MLKTFLSFSLVLAVSLPTAFSQEKKTSEQYWAETGLTSATLSNVITSRNCMRSADYFRGCINAINALAAQLKPSLTLVPTPLAGDREMKLGGVTKSFGSLALVKLLKSSEAEEEASPVSPRAAFEKSQAERKRLNTAIQDAYSANGSALPDFPAILSSISAEVFADKATEAARTAAAISAYFVEAMDAHARIEAKAELEDKMNQADESFTGLGAMLQVVQGKTMVQTPMDDSPALKAGLRANDVILRVDEFETLKQPLDEVVKRIRGPEGSVVTLHVSRNGRELAISITRGRIKTENIVAKMLDSDGQRTGYIRLRSFVDYNACTTIDSHIRSLQSKGASGLILDLRGNGGGLLDQANCIGGLFVGQKVIVKVKSLQSNSFRDHRSTRAQVANVPVVVLIDAGSASASEIVAGALQDHERAWIVGERSFGKGSVQAPSNFLNENIVLYRTIERFYQPLGRTNQLVGILPNFEVPEKPDATEDERFRLREGDIFPNALEALDTPWKETRPEAVAKVQRCLDSTGSAEARYERHKNDAMLPEYQVFYAEDVLRCSR